MKYFIIFGHRIPHFFVKQLNMWRLLLILLCAPGLAYATHIVGGEMGYRNLGNDQYEITLRLYRDCINGAANAPFDNPASIGIFDRNGLLLQDVRIAATKDTFLSNNLDACIQATTEVCVHTMTYKAVVSLPFRAGGYQIVYQRCCRNRTILNIVSPLETGATYDIWLTEAAMRRKNSSATFRRWPDIYICNNRPLDFDHSAIDLDGDSLVYRLCTPLQGATFANPQPQPPNYPPYDTLVWVNPIYNLYNMLGAGEPLRINSRTGLLTAKPGLLGQFVVGICVDEYDRKTKQLISSTRRDFQYNVQNCEGITAAFFAPESQCDSLKVSFRNESVGANNYLWHFDAPRTNLSSTEVNPMYTFPAYNTYTVSLIAEPNTSCADTFSRQVKLFKSGIKANFKAEVLACAAESIIRLQDLSMDSTAAIVKRRWKISFGDGGLINLTGADTLVRLPSNISGSIMLTVVNANGCEKTTSQPFTTTGGKNPIEGIVDSVKACVGTTLQLNPGGTATPAYSYRWEPAALFDNPNAVSPILTITQNAMVTLTITANSVQTCTFTKIITVIATPRPKADLSALGGVGDDPIVVSSCDGRTLNLSNQSSNADSVKWIIGDVNNPLLVSRENNPALTLADTGTYTLTLIAYGACNDTLQKTIRLVKQDTDVDFTFNYTNCILNGSTIQLLDVSNNPNIQIASRTWKLSDGRSSMEDSPSFSFTDTGKVTITLVIRTLQGCLDSAAQTIEKAPIKDVAFPDTIVVCRGMPLQLPGNNNPKLEYMWLPDTGLDDPTVGNPIFSPQQSTRYIVSIAVPGIPSCQTMDTMMAIVPGNMELRVLGAGADGTPVCTPQTTLTVTANRSATFRWLDQNENELGKGDMFTATVAIHRNLIVEATDTNGCKEKLELTLVGEPIVFSAPDSLIRCTNESLQINTTAGPGQNLIYRWTPLAAFESGALTANPVLAATPGIKRVFVEVQNTAGCILQDSVEVILLDANLNLDFSPEVQCDGATVVFQNKSTKAFGYVWNFGDGSTSTETSPTHVYAQPGDYTATLTLVYNVTCRKTVSKEIGISLDSSLLIKKPQDQVTCGEEVTLTAEGKPGTTIRWTTKQGELISTDPSVTINPPVGVSIYYLTVKDTLRGCTELDSVKITDNGVDVTLITPSGSNLINQCDAENVQVEVRNNAPGQELSYRWIPAFNVVSGGNTATPVLRPTEIGQNVIMGIISNQFECDDTLTVIINLGELNAGLPDTVKVCPGVRTPLAPRANDAYTYQWAPSTGLSATNVGNPSFTGSSSATYFVTVTQTNNNVSCQVVDTVSVLISPKPDLSVSTMDTTACVGTTLRIIASGATQYSWFSEGSPIIPPFQNEGGIAISTNQPIELKYTVIGRNGAGCTDTITGVRVRFVDFALPALASPLSICKGDTIGLYRNGNPAYQYQWSPGTGLDLTRPYNPVAMPTQTTRYDVTITDPVTTCFKEQAVIVNVNMVEGFKASNDTTICSNTGGLTLSADASGNNVFFRWLDSTGAQIGSGKTITINPGVGMNLYIVEATDGTCTERDTVKVDVKAFDPGDLASPQTACAGDTLALNPKGNPAYTYIWSPETGLDLSKPYNPIATLSASMTYAVTVTDPVSGCSVEKEIRVNVTNLSDLTVTPSDTTLCQPGSVTLRATGAEGANIRWLDANGNQIGTGRSISPSPNVGVNLYIAEASQGNCSFRDTAKVTLVDFQPGDLSSPQAACAGDTLALNPKGNPAYTYEWTPTIGLDLSKPYNPIATLIASVTYTVTVTDPASGCTVEKEVQVKVTDLSDLAITPKDTSVCQPGGLTLRISGAVGANIRWVDADGNQIGTGRSISPSLKVGLNLIIAEAQVGSCTARDTARVTLFDFQPGDLTSPQTACAGSPLALNPKGNPAYTYTWAPTTGLDLSNPHNPVATLNTAITYSVTVTDPITGCSTQKEIRVNVTDLSDLEAIPSETTLCQPDFVLLTARGAQGATIRWLDANGQVIFNGRSLSVTPGPGLNLYIAEATIGACSKRDTARVILVDFRPGDLRSPQNICVGASVELNPNGNPAYTYTWSPTTGLDLSNPFNPIASPTSTITYSVTVTDPATNCSRTKSIVVNVSQDLTVVALPDTSLCEPGQLTLRATTSRPTRITWFSDKTLKTQIGTGNRINVNVTPGKNVFYAVATDTNDLCIRARIDSVKMNGGSMIGKGGPFEGAPLDSAVIDVVDLSAGAPPGMITTCTGRPTPINPNGNPKLIYRWSPATGLNDTTSATPTTTVTVPTTYTVTISDAFGVCSIVRQVVVMASPPINADAGRDTTLCSLSPYSLMASGNGGAVFEWGTNRNISPVLGTGASFSITPDTVSRTYYVRITNGAGCSEIDSVRVIARPLRASLPATASACEIGDEIKLTVTNADPRQTLSYLWSPANLFITDVRTGPSATLIAGNGAQPQVQVTNQYGCSATLRTTINIVDLANKIRITANPTTIEHGKSSTISVENCPDCTYSWSPSTGLNTTTGSTVIASPKDTTEYTVKVTSNGCMAELKITINVAGPYCVEPYIFVPTAFTPNRDGVNDVLYVRGMGIDSMTFIIYNRWGQKVFWTSDPNEGWDGKFNEKQLPPDVYGFYLLAYCIDGTMYRKQGNVTLIR